PTRRSISQVRNFEARGPHQFETCSGFVIASKTTSRGASKSRVMRISVSDGRVTVRRFLVASGMFHLLLFVFGLEFGKVIVEAVKTLFPELAIVFHPRRGVFERRGFEAAGTPLR